MIPEWHTEFELLDKADSCNYRAGGELVAFYCTDGFIAATSISEYEKHSYFYENFQMGYDPNAGYQPENVEYIRIDEELNSFRVHSNIITATAQENREDFYFYIWEDRYGNGPSLFEYSIEDETFLKNANSKVVDA